jgi:CubicO group peptidase (beta-lactamase class C family)
MFASQTFYLIFKVHINAMKKIFILQLLLLSFLITNAQTVNSNSSQEVESNYLIADRINIADLAIQEWVDKGWMNGGVGLIMHNGNIAYYKAFGYDNIEKKTPMQVDHIFRIASQTKAITSVAVMMLFEEGKFLLDEPVSKFIPEFKNPQVLDKFFEIDSSYTTIPAKREITIRDLLTHTSGLGYAQIGSTTANAIYAKNGVVGGIGVDKITLEENIKRLGKLPLFHNPGERFTYGLNTDVLGYLVQVVSGMNFGDFLTKKIFEPLGMKDTYFNIPKEKQNRLVSLYSQKNGVLELMPETYKINGTFYRDYPNKNFPMQSGGGGLSSTIMDYAIFLQMMLNEGTYKGARILSRNTVRMMTMNQIGDINNGINKFGLGFGITTERGSAKLQTQENTFDWGGMFATTYWVDPREKIVGLFFRNVYPTQNGDISDRFRVLMYQAIKD